MKFPFAAGRVRLFALLALLPLAARAQAPAVLRAGLAPAANARAVARDTRVSVPFSQPVGPGTASNIRVFSQQYRGQRQATASSSGNTVTLTPAAAANGLRTDFQPGETVVVSVPAAVRSLAGVAAVPYVYQFTAATTGGTGRFAPGADVAVGRHPYGVVTGDVDGDGDLDLLTADYADFTMSVRLNDGAGNFGGGSTVRLTQQPFDLTLGDIDGDGDLDVLLAEINNNTIGLCLNNGAGSFTYYPQLSYGLNPASVALGDVDSDGDLDLLGVSYNGNAVGTCRNDGTGHFKGNATGLPDTTVAVGNHPYRVALGDIDGDGDLDLLTANSGSTTVSVRLNDGQGNFSGNTEVDVGGYTYSVALGDVDGDGDFDLLAPIYDSSKVSIRFNNGAGSFGGGGEVGTGQNPRSLALGDLDGDGDLDLLTANTSSNTVSIRLNQNQAPLATTPTTTLPPLTLHPNPAPGTALLSGTAPGAAVQVLDALGRVVATATADAGGATRLPAGLAPGVYVVRAGGAATRWAVE